LNRNKAVIVICTWIVLCVASAVEAQVDVTRFWTLSEKQLNIPNGGRANTIALNPINPDRRYVASESGGLFKTENGDVWTHIDDLPVIYTESVVYNPHNSNFVYATAKADFKFFNGGGLWIGNSNTGTNWQHIDLNAPGHSLLSGYEIGMRSANDEIYVGTSEGEFERAGNGPWAYYDIFGGIDKSVYSVLATDTAVYFGGPSGIRVKIPGTAEIRTADLGPIKDMHAFGAYRLYGSAVFVVTAAGKLFVTKNEGTNWVQIPSAPASNATCKGIPFVKVAARTSGVQILGYNLYYSNGCSLYTAFASNDPGLGVTVNSWNPVAVDHNNPRDLALNNTVPLLLASNGGLHKTADNGQSWYLEGGGPRGYNALQAYQIRGQRTIRTPHVSYFDRYIGTQDNNLWAVDGQHGTLTSVSPQGHHIETDAVIKGINSKITFAACVFSCSNKLSGHLFDHPVLWPNVPQHKGTPVVINDCQFVQNSTARRSFAINVTEQCGIDWQPFTTGFRNEPRDVPMVARSGFDPSGTTILYQAYKTNKFGPEWAIGGGQLLRADRQLFSSEPVDPTFPLMGDFGVLGFGPTMLPVFAIDPSKSDRIIAADVENSQGMKKTEDGGDNWAPLSSLTSVATRNGLFGFASALSQRNVQPIYSLVTAVSFCPQNPSLAIAGTSEGGILVSNNHGTDWTEIEGTRRVTNTTSFAWENANRVYISTFGRGLWRLDNRTIDTPDEFEQLCGPACQLVPPDGAAKSPSFDNSIMVFDGTVLGVRTENKLVREVFVTPGSSIVFTGDAKDSQDDIAITESDNEKDVFEPLPKGPDGWIAKGIVMMSDDTMTGAVFGDAVATLVPPADKDTYGGGSKESPTNGKPYVTVLSEDFDGVATVTQGETFELSGSDFVAGVSYEALIDGELAKGSATADGDGSFSMTVAAPSEPGYHRIDVRAVKSETILDASVIFVR